MDNDKLMHTELRNDELMHYGRKGMKWYQHVFTNAASVRSNHALKKAEKQAKKDTKETSKQHRRIKKMSDDELKKNISRLKLEKEYKDLKTSSNNKAKAVSAGKKAVGQVLGSVAKNASTQLLNHYSGMLLNYTAMKTDPKIAEALKVSVNDLNQGAIYKSKLNTKGKEKDEDD
jgi:hypothetical protein